MFRLNQTFTRFLVSAFLRGSLSHGFPIAWHVHRSTCVSWQIQHGQFLRSRHGFASSRLPIHEHCLQRISWIHLGAYDGSWRLIHNQYLASNIVPWNVYGLCCQYPWVFSKFPEINNKIYNISKYNQIMFIIIQLTYGNFIISVRLMANELLRSLLDDLRFECWSDCHSIMRYNY